MKSLATAVVLLASTAFAAAADAIDMCLEMNGATEAACICATDELATDFGAEDLVLYDAVGLRYLANKAAGQGMGDAWDAAIADTAAEAGMGRTELLSRMNDVGQAHRDAIGGCE